MKLIICALIILLSAAVGYCLRSDIKRRCESLESLCVICRKIQGEISFRSPPLSELMEKCSTDQHCGELFSSVRADLSLGFRKAWRNNAEKWSARNCLDDEERDTVMMLDSLGSTDVEGERQLLENTAERLKKHAENARADLASRGKMMFSCSMLTGLALVIIII